LPVRPLASAAVGAALVVSLGPVAAAWLAALVVARAHPHAVFVLAPPRAVLVALLLAGEAVEVPLAPPVPVAPVASRVAVPAVIAAAIAAAIPVAVVVIPLVVLPAGSTFAVVVDQAVVVVVAAVIVGVGAVVAAVAPVPVVAARGPFVVAPA